MSELLIKRLNLLAKLGGDGTVIDAEEANYILIIMSEYKEMNDYCASLEDALIEIQTTANNASKGMN